MFYINGELTTPTISRNIVTDSQSSLPMDLSELESEDMLLPCIQINHAFMRYADVET